jgi:polyisoprenoid-binding protein YceI
MSQPESPSRSRRWLPIVVVGAVLLGGLGAYLAWDQFLRGDAVGPLDFASRTPGAASPTAASPDPSATPSSGATTEPTTEPTIEPSAPASGDVPTAAILAGEWEVGDGTVVGYRVRERLAFLQADTDAVGRTTAVTGSATLTAAGDTLIVTDASFEADVTQLQSDEGRRDNRIRTTGLESDRFPTATFRLTAPVDVPADALTGATVPVTLIGDLTVHGVTKAVEIPAEARLTGETIEVLGSLAFPFSDFGMEPPNIAGFVSVEDDATLEFLVVLAPA